MKKQILITIIVALVIGAGGFFGGMTWQKNQDSIKGITGEDLMKKLQSLGLSDNGVDGGFRISGADGNIPSGGFSGPKKGGDSLVNGQIISKDSQSITVKQQDGSTKTVYYSSSTTIGKMTQGTLDDLAVGTQVTTSGTSNSDGSITAQTIQIRPQEQ